MIVIISHLMVPIEWVRYQLSGYHTHKKSESIVEQLVSIMHSCRRHPYYTVQHVATF